MKFFEDSCESDNSFWLKFWGIFFLTAVIIVLSVCTYKTMVYYNQTVYERCMEIPIVELNVKGQTIELANVCKDLQINSNE